MSNMISVASGFQYSVNIGYDLNNDDKLKNFIPTQSALTLLEDILLSTRITSTERARVLIGAYGKGKLALDEDDVVAIASRDLIDTHPLFARDRLLDSRTKAIL